MKKVLFVDDEPHVLEGLRHRLYGLRSRWEMFFAESGKTALEILGREQVDVIVTDMRMPQMDGTSLLKKVQELAVVRIVLSGHGAAAEMETALRTVAVAPQFVTKPSEPGEIENVVERACNLQLLVNDDTIKRIIGKIDNLPSSPRLYSQLVAALSNENASAAEVARILKQDVAICAKTLQVVNSAFFRLSRSVANIEEAVTYLGLNTIKHIALVAEAFQQGHGRRFSSGLSLDALQEHALLVGEVASSLFADKQTKEDAFVAGLLRDIGKLVLAVELPEHLDKVLLEMKGSGCTMHGAEEKVWGVTHAEVGGYLLGIWGLPYPVIQTLANHHAPRRVDTKEFGILAATHVANVLVHDELDPRGSGPPSTRLDPGYLEYLGVTGKVDTWRETTRRHLEKRPGLGR